MEAGRYSKPVVARRLPVLDELLGKGGAGLLVGTPDRKRNAVDVTAEELAASLYQLLNSPEECVRLGQNCRRVSDKFVWPEAVKRFEAVYQRALDNREEAISRRFRFLIRARGRTLHFR